MQGEIQDTLSDEGMIPCSEAYIYYAFIIR